MGEKKQSMRKIQNRAAALGLCACMAVLAPGESLALAANGGVASGSNAEMAVDEVLVASESNAAVFSMRSLMTGDLWKDWVGDLSFLDGDKGDGTAESPYQISTKSHLMGLSELAARGMVIGESEGTWPGDYNGAYFKLMKNIDLGGMDWMPIGFYQSEADLYVGDVQPFCGHFDGNGKTISNFRIYNKDWSEVGLFGALEDASVENLTVKPGYVITAGENVGILAGSAKNSEIRNVTVNGTLSTSGNTGGVAGSIADGTVIENCTADHVAMDSGTEQETFTGGIAGTAAGSLIIDCVVNTGDSLNARIQGDGYVGGIVGFQNDTDIFNVHVMGTIGGSGSQSIGGVTGKYASGKLKVARFEGTIASSGMGSAAREGTFIGTHDTGFHFRYGTEAGADVAYLFADKEAKIAAGICGSGIPDDNSFTYDAHIGFWHDGDNFFTLIQGQNTKKETEQYFYEKMEEGILHLVDTEDAVREMICSPDHFAPNSVGRPIKGYLVSVLQIDTAANVENYYDVATLTARGSSAYSKELDKENRGAVAAGDVVTVMTAPKNTESEKYQMDGVPTYTDTNGDRTDMSYQTGGAYTFVMPECDTEISAVYKKVAAEVRVLPEEYNFKVVQERSGDRKNPSIITEVRNGDGKLIARYVNGELEEGTKVQDVTFDAIVDKNNDVADSRVSWSVDDGNLLILKKNSDEDSEGYTEKSASVELNLQADFFKNIIEEVEKEQRENQYRYPIADTVYGNGVKGGIAILTAKTRASESFEGKPVMANCRIPVTFQIKDRTKAAIEKVSLNKEELTFTVTRTLTGNRKAPKEEIQVSAPQTLTAVFEPTYFDKRTVTWEVDDVFVIQIDAGEYGNGAQGEDYKTAVVEAVQDAKWIRDIMAADDMAYANDASVKRSGTGTRNAAITVTADDVLGNKAVASCKVTVNFVTEDKTVLYTGSSGGSSSGSGKASGKNVLGSGTADVLKSGVWTQETEGKWMYTVDGKIYSGEWAYIYNPYAGEGQEQVSWFRFDGRERMMTGWYQDETDGSWYYLHEVPDGSQGHMYTGWHEIDGKWYFFGTDGRMYSDRETPDGYKVDASGAWIVDGVVQVSGK